VFVSTERKKKKTISEEGFQNGEGNVKGKGHYVRTWGKGGEGGKWGGGGRDLGHWVRPGKRQRIKETADLPSAVKNAGHGKRQRKVQPGTVEC